MLPFFLWEKMTSLSVFAAGARRLVAGDEKGLRTLQNGRATAIRMGWYGNTMKQLGSTLP